jgi:Arc/MetJ-type ribon-helix-helix transcriptional regulator
MTIQIAVRIPDDLLAFVDEEVSEGRARSRADLVTRTLARARQQQIAAHDAEILAREGNDPDLLALAQYAARRLTDLE